MPRTRPTLDPFGRRGLRRGRIGRRRVALRPIPVRAILPNLVTLLALCLGLTAIRMTFEGRYEAAIAAVVLAAVLDAVDGRMARALRSTSRFGAELDSLTDFVNFGVAPAIMVYGWILDEIRSIGWLAALTFAICAALRLARFNVMLLGERPAWQSAFFMGVPAPAAAITVLLPLYLSELGIHFAPWAAWIVLVYAVAIGLLMVSRLPTFSAKTIGTRVRRDLVLPILVLSVVLVGLLVSYPFAVLAAGTLAYLAALPAGLTAWRRLADRNPAGAAAAGPGEGGPGPARPHANDR